jgi:hypothetical protein
VGGEGRYSVEEVGRVIERRLEGEALSMDLDANYNNSLCFL